MLDNTDGTVITASAGNHGLAVATAALSRGRPAVVFVPAAASEIKVRRIASVGAETVPMGRDVLEATKHAQAEAAERGWRFISPYADLLVAAGNGTSVAEEIDGTTWDTVIVPVGGGGLIAAAGAVLKATSPRTRVIGVYPRALGRGDLLSGIEEKVKMPVLPTVADGLAVQQVAGNPLLQTLSEVVDEVIEVGEAEIYTAIYALLHIEGVLAEGGGAIGAAVLLDPSHEQATGRTLILISGGNIASSDLMRALVVEVSDLRLRKLLGLRTTTLTVEALAPQAVVRDVQQSASDIQDATTLQDAWHEVSTNACQAIYQACDIQLQHLQYTDGLGLREDNVVREALHDFRAISRRLATRIATDTDLDLWRLEARTRLLLRCNRFLNQALEWNSAASDQSQDVNFFDPAEQRTAMVNYARYGSSRLGTFERRLCSALGFDPLQQALLATSSGMAAYQLIEAFLVREILRPGDWMVYAPYIYFEAAEQVTALGMFRHAFCADYSAETLIKHADDCNATVLWLDPVANIAGTPAIDLKAVAQLARGAEWATRWLIIDGTMVSGGINPFAIFSFPDSPRVLYYESGSKYLQWGMDLQMHGVVVAERVLHPRLHQLRRNSGTTMYPGEIFEFPEFTREEYLARLRHLTENATMLAMAIHSSEDLAGHIEVGFCHQWQKLGWGHGGAVVTVTFVREGLNNRDHLEGVIDRLLQRARVHGVRLTKGVSFGFSCTRVSAASAMAEGTDPFLRFSVGEASRDEMEQLCSAVVLALCDAVHIAEEVK
jgi:threonine dehydratase/cystathionine beta-lyase/cystathionine gamma-synthase